MRKRSDNPALLSVRERLTARGQPDVSSKTDYSTYRLNAGETAFVAAVYMAVAAAVGVLFYDSVAACLVLAPGMVAMLKSVSAGKCASRKKKLDSEFKEFLVSLSANMGAGYALESAFVPVYQELDGMYQGKSLIQEEVLMIIRGLRMSEDVDVLLSDFAERSDIDDIKEFAKLVSVAKGSGGNLIHMMKLMITNMDGRMEVEDEVDTLVTSKRLEQNIMSAMPFVIILYLRVCNPGYMDVLYGNALGIAVMSLCLAAVMAAVVWGRRIIDIRV